MDPVKNPYTPNAGSRPPELAGRDEQLEQFRILVARLKGGQTDQSLIAKGLRGVGKTVLLNAFEDMAESEGFLTYYHELTDESSLVEELARDIERALGMLKLSEKLAQKVRDGLGHLKTIRLTGPEGIGIEVDLRKATEGTVTADLTDLFLELGAAAKEKGRGVVFFLDEVQFVDEMHYRALISALHRCNQKRLPISAAAAGLPQIPRLTGEARSYAERLFDFPTIANLDSDAARAALVEPAARKVSRMTPAPWSSHSSGPRAIRSTSSRSGNTPGTKPPIHRSRARMSRRRCQRHRPHSIARSTRSGSSARRRMSANTCGRWPS